MILWFVGTGLVTVWMVFRDPAVDHRVVVLGALLPDVIDAPFGGARAAHALVAPVMLLIAIMVATIGRRAVRRTWLMVPIGWCCHLIFDGVVGSTKVFMWPIGGDLWPNVALPVVSRGWWNVVLEALGAVLIAWLWRMWGLSDATRRQQFLATGRIDRAHLAGEG
jgi:hypothetical protein